MHCSGLRKGVLACWTHQAFLHTIIDYDLEYHREHEHTLDHYYFNILLQELSSPTYGKGDVEVRCTLEEYKQEIEKPGTHQHVWTPAKVYKPATELLKK